MSTNGFAVLALAFLAARCAGDPPAADPVQQTARESSAAATTSAVSGAPTVSRSFAASGITTVVLRAAGAAKATVQRNAGATIEVTGIVSGGAQGYHSPDPNWRETPAAQWGLDFAAKQFGNVLVISTANEMAYIHHSYTMHSLILSVPAGIEVVPVTRVLNGNGAPDLSAPPVK